MDAVTAPLRAEHRALKARFTYLLQIADRATETGGTLATAAAGDLHDFLSGYLLPHCRAEDEVLYPAIDTIAGSRVATAALRRQHAEIVQLADRLAQVRRSISGLPLTRRHKRELRRTLYGLQAVVLLHLATEEELYLPLLDDTLDTAAAAALFGRMNVLAVGVA